MNTINRTFPIADFGVVIFHDFKALFTVSHIYFLFPVVQLSANFRKARLLERREKEGLGMVDKRYGFAKGRKRGKGFVVVSEQCRVGEKILELCDFRATLHRDGDGRSPRGSLRSQGFLLTLL